MENLGIEPDFWDQKKVFITGHTGFKGSWLCLWLKSLGARVSGYALEPPTSPSLFDLAGVARGMDSIIGDVRDAASLYQTMANARPEIAFHLAAQPLVLASYQDPVYTFATNLMGTVHFLEAVRRTPSLKAAVVITSDKCYENCEQSHDYCEGDPMGGRDPYSCSKGCAELASSAYARSFFEGSNVGLATARAGNIIGGGDWAPNRLVPDMIRAFADKQVLQVRNPQAVRPWQHVLEPLRGYLRLAKGLYNGDAGVSGGWNFGPDGQSMQPVETLADMGVEIWGGDASWETAASPGPHEAALLTLDCSRALSELAWAPLINLKTSIEWTLQWYRAWYMGQEDLTAYSLEQIARYQNMCRGQEV